jgi:ribosome maturation factor RimP
LGRNISSGDYLEINKFRLIFAAELGIKGIFRGDFVPYFICGIVKMIQEELIVQLVREKLEGTGKFLVEVKVKPSNKIHIFIDDEEKGLAVGDCVELSRFIESQLNREVEDFELEVSSPGLDQPMLVFKQFIKSIGRQVAVIQKDGIKHVGKLIAADEQGITVEKTTRERTDASKKKKELITEHIQIRFPEIKETRKMVSFN